MPDLDGEPSLFIGFFGDTPQWRIVDFLMENRLRDFTKTEIAKGAKISWASLFNHWKELERNNIVKVTRRVGRAALYQLDEGQVIVKQLKRIEMQLMRNAAGQAEEEIVVKAKESGMKKK